MNTSRAARAALAVLGPLALAAAAAPASADVLVIGDPNGPLEGSTRPVTLHLGDGTSRPLARVTGVLASPLVPSPDRRFVAGASPNGRIRVIATDGRPPRTFGLPGLSGGAGLAWSRDGARITVWGLETRRRRRAVTQTCVLATGACTIADASRTTPVGALADGRLFRLAMDPAFPDSSLLDQDTTEWKTQTAAEIAQVRRLLRRRFRLTLTLDGRDGGPPIVLRRVRQSLGRGLSIPAGELGRGAGSTVLGTVPIRYGLRTRHRDGRLQSRPTLTFGAPSLLRVTPDGQQRSVPGKQFAFGDGDLLGLGPLLLPAFAEATNGDWVTIGGQRKDHALVRTAFDGRASPLLVGGRPASAEVLLSAVGVPAKDTASGREASPAFPIDYESATDSLIVAVDDRRGRGYVLRVPLSGDRPPTVVVKHAQWQLGGVAAW